MSQCPIWRLYRARTAHIKSCMAFSNSRSRYGFGRSYSGGFGKGKFYSGYRKSPFYRRGSRTGYRSSPYRKKGGASRFYAKRKGGYGKRSLGGVSVDKAVEQVFVRSVTKDNVSRPPRLCAFADLVALCDVPG